MALDAAKNFGKITVSTGYDASATSIALISGDGAKLPDPSTDGEFNLVWWCWGDYKDPSDDSNVEIVRCTARSTDTLTVTRAQESTSASTKNNTGKTYKMILGVTAKTITDIQARTFGLTASRALETDASGDIGVSAVTKTELNYLDGVTSAIQTQFDNKQPLDADLAALAALSSTGLVARTGTATYSERTITGTADKITVTNGDGVSGNPTLTVASTYVGQNTITTLGTVATGTWSATTIAVNKGGTGQTSYTDGQLLIGNTTGNTLAKATLTGTANQITVTNGSGSITLSTPQDIATGSSPTFAGLTCPTIVGGTATTSDLNLKTTTGAGTTGADMHFLVGNNGGTEAMTILNGGNVGIGTTGPSYNLHVNSSTWAGIAIDSAANNQASLLYRQAGVSKYQTYISGDGLSYNIYDTTDRFTIKGGNVGIGTTSPSGKLDIVVADTNNVPGLEINQNDTTNNPKGATIVNAGIGDTLFLDSNNYGKSINIDGDCNSANDIIGIHVNVANAGAGEAYAAIFEAGKVGIGTTTPTNALTIKNDDLGFNLAGTDVLQLGYKQGGSTYSGHFSSKGAVDIVLDYDNSSTTAYFRITKDNTDWDAGTELFRVQEDGKVGIGLTPTANMVGLSIEAGCLTLKERATPTADADYGKIYTKNDNKLYFQDGAGTEHEIAYVP